LELHDYCKLSHIPRVDFNFNAARPIAFKDRPTRGNGGKLKLEAHNLQIDE